MEVRTRFAPSPTGYLHLGGLRTALYTYLFARRNGGKVILRIEDTDQEREVPGAVEKIYASLAAAGLSYDEGPDVGGEYGPYIQTQRRDLYLPYAQELVRRGGAYYCFCTKERLDEARAQAEKEGKTFKYDKHCLHLSPEEVKRRIEAGEPYVIRQNVPTEGKAGFDDLLYGHVEVDCSTLDDNVLIKADGLPTYNFANVVDDHLMAITHVMRGTEYLSSAPKYNLLYEAFGWDIPTYIHVPPVMKDATHKLSKRNGDASFEDLVAKGYLEEAVINYIALLGWAPKGENEVFTLPELVEAFDVSGISKSPAIFDGAKLKAINGEYIRRLTPEKFIEDAKPYIDEGTKRRDLDLNVLAEMLQPRTEVFTDIPGQIDFIDALPDYDIAMYTHKKMQTNAENSLQSLRDPLPVLESVPADNWNVQSIHDAVFQLIADKGVKSGRILWPLRVAASGKQFTPGGGIEIAALLGKDETIARVRKGIEKLEASRQ